MMNIFKQYVLICVLMTFSGVAVAGEQAFGLRFGMTKNEVKSLIGGDFYTFESNYDNAYEVRKLPDESLGVIPKNTLIHKRYLYFDRQGKLYRVLAYVVSLNNCAYEGDGYPSMSAEYTWPIYVALKQNIENSGSYKISKIDETTDNPENLPMFSWSDLCATNNCSAFNYSVFKNGGFDDVIGWDGRLDVAFRLDRAHFSREYLSIAATKVLSLSLSYGSSCPYHYEALLEACEPDNGQKNCETRRNENIKKPSAL